MALILRNQQVVCHMPRPAAFPRGVGQILAKAMKWATLAWIGANVLTWAPSVDAHGECNCPLCHPFELSHGK
ncbi:MAG: hypothetical protein JSS72_03605 [Armatimonadetes bacterium]|nr:hypothetical protein [Armatimonadota bacterium]